MKRKLRVKPPPDPPRGNEFEITKPEAIVVCAAAVVFWMLFVCITITQWLDKDPFHEQQEWMDYEPGNSYTLLESKGEQFFFEDTTAKFSIGNLPEDKLQVQGHIAPLESRLETGKREYVIDENGAIIGVEFKNSAPRNPTEPLHIRTEEPEGVKIVFTQEGHAILDGDTLSLTHSRKLKVLFETTYRHGKEQ